MSKIKFSKNTYSYSYFLICFFLISVFYQNSLSAQKIGTNFEGRGFDSNYRFLLKKERNFDISYLFNQTEAFNVNADFRKFGFLSIGCAYEFGDLEGYYFRSSGEFSLANPIVVGTTIGWGHHFPQKKENKFLRAIVSLSFYSYFDHRLGTFPNTMNNFIINGIRINSNKIDVYYKYFHWKISSEIEILNIKKNNNSNSFGIGGSYGFLTDEQLHIYAAGREGSPLVIKVNDDNLISHENKGRYSTERIKKYNLFSNFTFFITYKLKTLKFSKK